MDRHLSADSKATEKAPDQPRHSPDAEKTPEQSHGLVGWLEDNVAKPFVSGTGVLKVASNFTENPISWEPPKSTNKLEWAVQNLSSAGGALLMYVPIGRATSGILGMAGRGLESGLIAGGAAEGLGASAKLFASASAGQILGAGLYDALKKPGEGETRMGNAVGSMAGFSAFELGNRALLPFAGNAIAASGARQYLSTTMGETFTRAAGATATGAGRYLVGGIGGLGSFETTTRANALLTGQENNATSEQRWDAIYSGGFVNFGLPVAQRLATSAVDKTINSASWGRGVPVGRQLGYSHAENPESGFNHPELTKLATQNPLARVKTASDGVTRADVKANTVYVSDSADAGKLAHELTHLKLARQIEPEYLQIGAMVKDARAANSSLDAAEQKFYQLRSYAENEARMSEARVSGNPNAPHGATADGDRAFDTSRSISQQRAGNGSRYEDIWRDEWSKFKENTNFRPRIEFDAASSDQPADGPGSPVWGSPDDLGATIRKDGAGKPLGTNFATYAPDATALDLLLFDSAESKTPTQRLPMFKTGDVWHRFVPDVSEGQKYLLQADGPYDPVNGKRVNRNLVLIDPYSKAVTGDTQGPLGYDNSDPNDPNRHLKMGTESNIDKMPKSVVIDPDKFDWTGDKQPPRSLDDTIILEINVPGFTLKDGSLPEHIRGTYAGLAAKAGWLQDFGITDVQVMPMMEFDADDWGKINPLTGEKLYNSWGYNTVAFQAPEHSYAASGNNGEQATEFQQASKTLRQHDVGIIPDIVLNHTREGDEHGPTIEFKGLSNEQAYMLKPDNRALYENHTGTGNTVNSNHPAMRRFIMDTLHYWANNMRVTGFRFDLASAFKFDTDGQHKWKTPII
jgi:hypothetical protein